MENVFDVLEERGFIQSTSANSALRKHLSGKQTLYAGFDPSADSLQLGNLLVVMALAHFQRAGHKVIFLVGGGTGLVGDPTGKSQSRKQLTPEQVVQNAKAVQAQVEQMGLLSFSGRNKAELVNNYDWLKRVDLMQLLLEIAPHFSVNEMAKMQTFAARLESGEGLSLLEFLYPVLQAYDFLHLFEQKNCTLQVGGSDQWGNILQGIDLIRRKHRKPAYALTFPLLTTASGSKMGKSEQGTIWLSAGKTKPFELFQYLQGLDDTLVAQMLPLYTFMSMEEIDSVLKNPRTAQIRLATEVTKLVHGTEEAQAVLQTFQQVRNRAVSTSTEAIPEYHVTAETALDSVLVGAGCVRSKSVVRDLCASGAIWIEAETNKISNPKEPIRKGCLVRYGRGKYLKVVV